MRLAAYQFATSGNLDRNIGIIKKAIEQASEKKVDLIIFPECALTGYPPRDLARADCIDVNAVSESIQELQRLADELDIHVIVGTIDYADFVGVGCDFYHWFTTFDKKSQIDRRSSRNWYDKGNVYLP